eukprot:TRINITY_DN7815_c0_g1_i16.p1 TRINITY_DN7815_c0_g1~~TRINITY_DN7815_c0_g1_i16.p1  ORF type:complete len:159 (+),score=8.72 TRINITY_DN7815_c0_g1_i16:451-927(+)
MGTTAQKLCVTGQSNSLYREIFMFSNNTKKFIWFYGDEKSNVTFGIDVFLSSLTLDSNNRDMAADIFLITFETLPTGSGSFLSLILISSKSDDSLMASLVISITSLIVDLLIMSTLTFTLQSTADELILRHSPAVVTLIGSLSVATFMELLKRTSIFE